ncbi:MBL fold metallo-hydrolase [Leucobacter allii]|uniref:MBL fold metallo-hydrolase n=1 Tax=Leucobacter allii TaxID=2932247 RepID=UPI003D2B19B2
MSAAPTLQEVAGGVWAYVQPDGGWMVNNMGLIAGADGATSIDATSTEPRMRAYLAAVARTTPAPVRRLVLTHAHPDHCNGASLLPDAEVIAHRAVAEELARPHALAPHIFEPFAQGDIRARRPTLVFEDAIALLDAERRIEVRHPGGPAHTAGDAYVWLPDDGVLFTGDLVFSGGTPSPCPAPRPAGCAPSSRWRRSRRGSWSPGTARSAGRSCSSPWPTTCGSSSTPRGARGSGA